MRNLITKKVIVRCDLTPEQWGLFFDHEDSPKVADRLNDAVTRAFNTELTTAERYAWVDSVMRAHSHVGASDSEPRWTLEQIFEEMGK